MTSFLIRYLKIFIIDIVRTADIMIQIYTNREDQLPTFHYETDFKIIKTHHSNGVS